MTTPSGAITLSDVNTELVLSSTATISLNDTNVRRLAGILSGGITMNDLRSKTWLLNLTGIQSAASCYSAQGGFSVDRLADGNVYLTMGVWPTDPPNCQTCSWTWLNNGGIGSSSSYNSYRSANNIRPYWSQVWSINITSMSIGSNVQTRAPSWPYTLVSYTYKVTRTAINSISIIPYPEPWGTGDTGTQISIENWWNNVASLGGGGTGTQCDSNTEQTCWTVYNPGQINLSWTSLGY